MATADVTVMGAGVFGLSVAYACARRGAAVRVIDPHGVASGSSGGLVGALAPHVPENWNEKKAFQFESLIMAEAFWRDVAGLSGVDVGYARSGRLQPLADDRAVELARGRADTAAELWEGKALWEVVSSDDANWMPPSPAGLVVHDTLSALIHPRRATRALADAVVALGGQVLDGGDPQGKVVWATGWPGMQEIGGNGVKGQAALLRFDAAGKPQLFADALHIIPHGDGTVAVGSTSERAFDNPFSTDEALDDVLARAMLAFPILHGAEVLERWAGVRPRSKSRAPVLGAHPLRDGEFIANGGFKIGFGMAPKVGAVMAALVLDGDDQIPDGFRA
ncbi:glycine/D-amino acid oxidase-like deaminating enzyme [Yoonia maricola]|uniref:Glycine/D-amino acid oxidase-like deaminating enzyme n=1 Tax=Yoonia maricola TaxID=420999 RepID=A0A2M8W6F9_9RHOB|nr:FAD-dependent oxidoreductase [Yoonia maricola]PJI86484.1 glycine/D-amino acid oxidase-like deaminating enzyme [Yoonia maricola]